ncbi:MAG: TonB-dependent receptor [Acidobacteriota bacterium]
MLKKIGFIALALLLATSAAYGQAQKGTITVTVAADDGSRLPGTTVTATSPDTLTRRTVVTDADGTAKIVAVDPATNYTVQVELEGFETIEISGVIVRAGQTTPLEATLGLAAVAEVVQVTAEAPLVDVSKTQAGQDITLQLTESLPTARSYQDYLQLVPGVQDGIDDGGNNPASRSGLNYQDNGGDVGTSTDNVYYFDGINVTDRTAGTFGANLNTEIIQEQSVLTGAIPAEFVGAPGLISNVVTKSGGNQFSGSINYYFQDDSLVEDDDNFDEAAFSTFDTAATLGGPVLRDKLWFFASYRNVNREDDVVSPDGGVLRAVEREGDQAFGKLTWSITDSDLLTGVFLSDPTDVSGSNNNQRSNARDFSREQGGDRWSLSYNRVWGAASFELALTDHDGDLNDAPVISEARNTVSFADSNFTQAEEQLGGEGNLVLDTRSNELQRASLEYLFDSSFGDHTLKIGYEQGESALFEDEQFTGSPPAQYVSITSRLAGQGVRLGDVDGTLDGTPFSELTFISDNQDNTNGLNNTLANDPRRDVVLAAWDDNGNGFLDPSELAQNMVFDATDGNPNGQINYTRDLQTATGPRTMSSEFWQAYIQDSWQWQRWSVNAGVRIEQWEHFASTGDSIIQFDSEIAPRLSVSYDLRGDGRSSLGAFYGRYYDAVRNNMTNFAGSLTGQSVQEQVWVAPLQDFVTYRTRGGPAQQDGFFAPSIETPYTDEIQLQYKQDLGSNMAFEINLIDREVADIMEDFSPTIYFDPAAYPGPINDPNSFFLGADYLGFDGALPAANFYIATLPSEAFRDWQGVELVFRKRYSDNWQLLASYNYADAEANSNSDSNADFAGDFLFADPRAPNREGIQPGLVEHLFKAAASYDWDNGIQVGATYRWNSGVILNRSGSETFGRHLPDRVDTPFEFAGVSQRYIAEGAIGAIDGSEYGVLDLRLAYVWDVNDRLQTDFFIDVFNALDDQQTIRVQDLELGGDGFEFLEGVTFVNPRRYFVGARLRF